MIHVSSRDARWGSVPGTLFARPTWHHNRLSMRVLCLVCMKVSMCSGLRVEGIGHLREPTGDATPEVAAICHV